MKNLNLPESYHIKNCQCCHNCDHSCKFFHGVNFYLVCNFNNNYLNCLRNEECFSYVVDELGFCDHWKAKDLSDDV